jgi:hypothetical protein
VRLVFFFMWFPLVMDGALSAAASQSKENL